MTDGAMNPADEQRLDDQLELLDLLLDDDDGEVPGAAAKIEPLESRAELPLSFAQQRVWFLDQWQDGSLAYTLSQAFRWSGGLRVDALRAAVVLLVSRHEVLRSRVEVVAGLPWQRVEETVEIELPLVDLRGLSVAAREWLTTERIAEQLRRPFDLSRGPLLRFMLLKTDSAAHVLLLTMHHLIGEASSIDLLMRELSEAYAARIEERTPRLPKLPIQYGDYAAWQRRMLSEGALVDQQEYWRRRLAGALELLPLPLDRPRPARRSQRGAVCGRRLSGALTAAGQQLAGRLGLTGFMFHLAVLKGLLARLSGERDILVGCPISGRTRPQLESLIGFFANTIVLRTELGPGASFQSLAAAVRERSLEAFENQDIQFEQLIEHLGIERRVDRTPLFNVLFAFEDAGVESFELPDLRVERWDVQTETAKFDLVFSLARGEDHSLLRLEYATDLFDAATAQRFLAYYERLLHAVVEAPDAELASLALLSAAEHQELVVEWSGAGANFEFTGGLWEAFVAASASRPEALALSCEGHSQTYSELHAAAESLAGRLGSFGVRPGDFVALLLPRDPTLVVAILATLRCAAAYVPVDPEVPAERLRFIAADSGATAWVTCAALRDQLPAAAGTVVEIEAGEPPAELAEPLPPWVAGDPAQAAYVIYTSGSTGRPKGVVVSHGQVLRLLRSTEAEFNFSAADVWTLFHSYAFDFSVWEIWGALLYGGRLVVVPYWVSRSPERFLELLAAEGVTVLNQTPSAFRQLIQTESARPTELALRWVVFGGEALDPSTLSAWVDRHGDAAPALVNMYGITETTVHVTYHRLLEAEVRSGFGSAIGRPLADLRLFVLDVLGQPVPRGVGGELVVGGAGVARGYLGRAGLTAARFVPDAYGGGSGDRLYRSGDLGRWLADGGVEYLGRLDQQVKVRGFRIELGEIEAVLGEHRAVAEVAVVARRDGDAEGARLVAYVVPAAATVAGELGPEQLRAHLEARLPAYMLPAVFVELAALPLTANGKLDRRALPAPEAGERLPSSVSYVAPERPTEHLLVAVWQEVLGVERVSVEDNFFALGGDSILSLRVLARAAEQGISLSLPDLFQHQTISALATALAESSDTLAAAEPTVRTAPLSLISAADRALLPATVEDAYPLSVLQAGMLYHMQLTPEDPLYHNVDSWHLRARFEAEVFQRAVAQVVARQPMMRTSFHLTGYSEALQLVHREAQLEVAVVDLRGLPAAEQEARIMVLMEVEKHRHFDLTEAPQLRFHIHLRTTETFQLTLTENHAIFDGWSLHSTLAEIFELYFELLDGASPVVPKPLSVTYRDFIHLEQLAIGSAAAESFWGEMLAGWQALELPRWPNPSGARPATVSIQSIAISEAVSEGLRRTAGLAGTPLKTVLLTAHMKALQVLSGQTDLLTGVVLHGRPEIAGADLLRGLFLNTLPLRLRLADGSWLDLLRQVFAGERRLLEHRRFPFGEVQRRWGDGPMFTAAFNYLHFHAVDQLMSSGRMEVLGFERIEPTDLDLQVLGGVGLLDGRVGCELDYDPARFSALQMRAMGGLYGRILTRLSRAPESSHGDLLLSSAERHQVVVEWNDRARAAAQFVSLPDLLAAQAERTPAAVAVSCAGQRLTYGELQERARVLLGELQRRGVGPGTRVGLCVERSLEMIAALWAILDSGAAYVPLDPGFPAHRLAQIVEDSGVCLLVTERASAERLPASGIARWVIDEAPLKAAVGCRPVPPKLAQSLAYVVYTSGSTGRPKGVQVPHQAVSNFLASMAQRPGLGAGDTLLAVTTLSFDIAVLELFLPLIVGGRLELARGQDVAAGERLQTLLRQREVSALQATPATWRLLLESGWEGTPGLLALCGGEVLPPDLARRLRPRVKALWNLYGPTETTVWSSIERVEEVSGSLPIGRAIDNTTLRLLNSDLAPVPIGVAAELYIGGDGVSRGYFAAPALSAERFVPDPLAGCPGARLYRTGDLARWRTDGKLDFLGRGDRQVKLRGYRVELGDIEACLGQHPGVSEAVVVVRGEGVAARLVAWVATGDGIQADQLRRFVSERLPRYMVPAACLQLQSLPRLPNGKLDHRALREKAPVAAPRAAAESVPRGTAEELLASIWSETLELPGVRREDDFFALGGHSLLATRLLARVQSAFGVRLQLHHLFSAPILRAQAELIGRLDPAAVGSPVAQPIERRQRDQQHPLSYAQQRLWFMAQLEPANPGYNMFSAFRFEGELAAAVLTAAFETVVRRHEVLRTRFESRQGEPQAVIIEPWRLRTPVVDLTRLPAQQHDPVAHRLLGDFAHRPFALASGPLVRVLLLRVAADQHLALFCIHHIIADAWSFTVLVREVVQLYEAQQRGRLAELPALPIQYVDYAGWQRDWLDQQWVENELIFWRRQLSGVPALLQLPADHQRRGGRFAGGTRYQRLEAGWAERLDSFSRAAGVTPYMSLLTAFLSLLHAETGAEDLVVGTDIGSRERLETENLIGCLVNSLVLRVDLSGEPSFVQLLERVRGVCLNAFAHQALPFDRLVEEIQPERRSGATPLVQVAFNLQNAPLQDLDLPGLKMSSVHVERRAARFDLVANLRQLEGGFFGTWEYRRDLFEPARVDRWINDHQEILRLGVAQPELPIGEIWQQVLAGRRQRQQGVGKKLKQANLAKFRNTRRRAVSP